MKWTPELAQSERYDECLKEYVEKISECGYDGKDLLPAKVRSKAVTVKSFLTAFSRQSVEPFDTLGNKVTL